MRPMRRTVRGRTELWSEFQSDSRTAARLYMYWIRMDVVPCTCSEEGVNE